MERKSNSEKILAAIKEKEVGKLKKELQQRTEEALKEGALKTGFKKFDSLNIEDMVLYGGVLHTKQTEVGPETDHVILRSDGKLYHVKAFMEFDVDGDWREKETLKKELTDEEYLETTSSIIEDIEGELGEFILLKSLKDKGIGA